MGSSCGRTSTRNVASKVTEHAKQVCGRSRGRSSRFSGRRPHIQDCRSESSSTGTLSDSDATKIIEKLAASKQKLDISVQSKVDWDKIVILPSPTATTINISLKEVVVDVNKADVEQKLKTWLKEVFTADPMKVELTTSLDGTKSTAGVDFNIGVGELAKKLKL